MEILLPEGKPKHLAQLIQVEFEHCIKMRVGNIHEPQAGVDVTKIPNRQAETLRRNGDTISPLRFTNMDDDTGNAQETADNTTTDAKDDHSDEENNSKSIAAAVAHRERKRRQKES